jgi:hypothetical protein
MPEWHKPSLLGKARAHRFSHFLSIKDQRATDPSQRKERLVLRQAHNAAHIALVNDKLVLGEKQRVLNRLSKNTEHNIAKIQAIEKEIAQLTAEVEQGPQHIADTNAALFLADRGEH